eukprot:5166062-Amphidinium_carterae.1
MLWDSKEVQTMEGHRSCTQSTQCCSDLTHRAVMLPSFGAAHLTEEVLWQRQHSQVFESF